MMGVAPFTSLAAAANGEPPIRKIRPMTAIPFRDEQSLVGVPYGRTKQAEPPIPIIPARSPLRPQTSAADDSTLSRAASAVTRPSRFSRSRASHLSTSQESHSSSWTDQSAYTQSAYTQDHWPQSPYSHSSYSQSAYSRTPSQRPASCAVSPLSFGRQAPPRPPRPDEPHPALRPMASQPRITSQPPPPRMAQVEEEELCFRAGQHVYAQNRHSRTTSSPAPPTQSVWEESEDEDDDDPFPYETTFSRLKMKTQSLRLPHLKSPSLSLPSITSSGTSSSKEKPTATTTSQARPVPMTMPSSYSSGSEGRLSESGSSQHSGEMSLSDVSTLSPPNSAPTTPTDNSLSDKLARSFNLQYYTTGIPAPSEAAIQYAASHSHGHVHIGHSVKPSQSTSSSSSSSSSAKQLKKRRKPLPPLPPEAYPLEKEVPRAMLPTSRFQSQGPSQGLPVAVGESAAAGLRQARQGRDRDQREREEVRRAGRQMAAISLSQVRMH